MPQPQQRPLPQQAAPNQQQAAWHQQASAMQPQKPKKSKKGLWVTLSVLGGIALIVALALVVIRVFGSVMGASIGGDNANLAPSNPSVFLDDRYRDGAELVQVPNSSKGIRTLGATEDESQIVVFVAASAVDIENRKIPEAPVFQSLGTQIGTLYTIDIATKEVSLVTEDAVFDSCGTVTPQNTVYCTIKAAPSNDEMFDTILSLVSVDISSGQVTEIQELSAAADNMSNGQLTSFGEAADGTNVLHYYTVDTGRVASEALIGVQGSSVKWTAEIPQDQHGDLDVCELVEAGKSLACITSSGVSKNSIKVFDSASGSETGNYEYWSSVSLAEDGFSYVTDPAKGEYRFVTFNYQGEELSREDPNSGKVQYGTPTLAPAAAGTGGDGALYSLDAHQYGDLGKMYVVDAKGGVVAQSSDNEEANGDALAPDEIVSTQSEEVLFTGWPITASKDGGVILWENDRNSPTKVALVNSQSGEELVSVETSSGKGLYAQNGYLTQIAYKEAGVFVPNGS